MLGAGGGAPGPQEGGGWELAVQGIPSLGLQLLGPEPPSASWFSVSLTETPSERSHSVLLLDLLSGLLRDGLFQVPQSVPACRPACLLRAGGGARLYFPEGAEHGVRGHGLQQRLPGAADIQCG